MFIPLSFMFCGEFHVAVGLVFMLGSWLNMDLVILDVRLCGGRKEGEGFGLISIEVYFWICCKISHHRKSK